MSRENGFAGTQTILAAIR